VDLEEIHTEREELTALFVQLKQVQQNAGVAEPNTSILGTSDSVDVWDDLAFDPVSPGDELGPTSSHSAQNNTRPITPVSIEDQLIAIPSNGNTSNVYRDLEITHRIKKADEELNNIRNLIAEKSFQFSHVIRVSPRKGVTTRSRAVVKKLNNQIAEHCRMYTRCRSCLLILGAESSILSHFQVLNPLDVSGSTAIINANEPGSTCIKLSWIWQTSARHIFGLTGLNDLLADDTPSNRTSLIECMSFQFNS
jgi:hypothetical protein